jgi:hypothetical protein
LHILECQDHHSDPHCADSWFCKLFSFPAVAGLSIMTTGEDFWYPFGNGRLVVTDDPAMLRS